MLLSLVSYKIYNMIIYDFNSVLSETVLFDFFPLTKYRVIGNGTSLALAHILIRLLSDNDFTALTSKSSFRDCYS